MEVYNQIKKDLMYLIALFLVLQWAYLHFGWNMDASDNHVTKERSNMKVLTDYGTGCEYLASNAHASLQPRLDNEGKHICKEGQ